VETGVTSRERLGIMGGSNGGLLMGAVLTQRPDIAAAVVCAVPVLDALRNELGEERYRAAPLLRRMATYHGSGA
jgi:prolyl oligopeptidase PreP (S9A serine peptidase family)